MNENPLKSSLRAGCGKSLPKIKNYFLRLPMSLQHEAEDYHEAKSSSSFLFLLYLLCYNSSLKLMIELLLIATNYFAV